MSQEYPGIPALAMVYWKGYVLSLIGAGIGVLIAGSVGALTVSQLFPSAFPLYAIAMVSVVVHLAAMYLYDVWAGDYDPEQATWTTPAQVFAMIVVLGFQISGMLLIATSLGLLTIVFAELSIVFAALLVAYYPVIDVAFQRKGYLTPGAVLFIVGVLGVEATFNIHETMAEFIPVVGKRYRPQS